MFFFVYLILSQLNPFKKHCLVLKSRAKIILLNSIKYIIKINPQNLNYSQEFFTVVKMNFLKFFMHLFTFLSLKV